MNRIYIFFFIISCILPYSERKCIDNIFLLNKDIIDDTLFLINAEINSFDKNQIKIYVKRNKKFRIDFDSSIIISDKNKIINYNKKTNQLFIENNDSLLNELFFSIGKNKLFYKNLKKYFSMENLKIFPNALCTSIDSIKFKNHETIFIINSFNFENSDLKSLDLDIDKEKTFIYDFR